MKRIGRGSVAILLVLARVGTQSTLAGSSFWRLWEQAVNAAEAGENERADKLYTKARRQERGRIVEVNPRGKQLDEAVARALEAVVR